MKYIKKRKYFLGSIKQLDNISESLENDITWGGSLLGRLISSTIRTGKIYYKTARINGLSDQVKTELDALIEETAFDKEQKEKIKNLKVRFLIEEIYKVVISKDSIDSKLTQLLGDKSDKSGLIMITISEIEKTQLKDKNKLIEKLKRFREALLGIDFDPKETSDEDNDNVSKSNEKSPEFNFYIQTLNLFKSVIGLNATIVNKRVVIEQGEESINKDPKNNLQNTNQPDNKNTTEQDKNISQPVTNDSFYYQNESLPIFENVAVIKPTINKKPAETDAVNVWNKIMKSFKNSNMPKISIQLQEIINKSKSGEKLDKSIIIALGKQILMNEKTLGKPISLDELIKEEAGTIPLEYKDIPKSISLISRVLMPLRDDMGILGMMDEAKSNITLFIKSIEQMRTLNSKLVSKNEKKLFNYNSFINEADEVDELDNELDNKETENTDKVKTEWYKEFKEGEEKEYKVNEEEAKTLQKETEEAGDKEFEIDANSYKDRIIRIVNIFGRAYKLYAVNTIPSGRPDGRISQKTFREYEYIGKETPPDWNKDSGPKGGPWMATMTFEKWENGIMKILEDTKYRSILANAKFINVGPNQKSGSGKTLFTFINDMIGEGGKDANFRQKRHRLLSEYFNGIPDIEKNSEPVEAGPGKISKDDYGKKGDLSFVKYSSLNRGTSVLTKNFTPDVNGNYNREFVRVSYTEDNKTKYLMGFIVGRINGTKDKGLAIKFHLSGKNQSIISTYLKKFIDDKTYNIPNSLVYTKENLYIGVVNITEHKTIKNGDSVVIKYSLIDGDNRIGKVEDLNIKIKSFESLCEFDPEKGNWIPIKIEGAPDNRPKYDLKNLDLIKTKASEFGIN